MYFVFLLAVLSVYAAASSQPISNELRNFNNNVPKITGMPIAIDSNPNILPNKHFEHGPSNIYNHESREKRSRREINELRDINDILEDLEENSGIQAWPSDIDMNSIQPRAIYLLVQKIKQMQKEEPFRVKTPRLGRTIENEIEEERPKPPFAPRLGKKSVPFKPRLGRRANLCDFS